MEVVGERRAFWDVHCDTAMTCARTPDGHGGRREEVREFATTTDELLALSAGFRRTTASSPHAPARLLGDHRVGRRGHVIDDKTLPSEASRRGASRLR